MGTAGDEEAPFIAGKMPMDFSHCARLDRDQRCAEFARDREGGRVNNLYAP